MTRSSRMSTEVTPIQVVAVSKGPSALRRLRELPPEIGPGPGLIETSRVLDARNPETAAALHGL
ncbi:MAG: hypothetical protein ACREJD_13535 [Phycisphaerales bacterium]